MNNLIKISTQQDISTEYRNTPVADLLEYHNMRRPVEQYTNAALLICTCMDNQIRFNIPSNLAYIIRTGGANMMGREFNISYAVAVGGIRHIALIGHNNCGMSGLGSKEDEFSQGLTEIGWDEIDARQLFKQLSPINEIGNEIDFTLNETKRLRKLYPKVIIAPMIYRVDDHLLYLIRE